MTIDINELRRRAEWGYKVASDIVIELLDRLEAAEKEREELRAVARHESDCVEAAKAEIKALRVEVGKLKDLEVSRCVKINGYIVDNARLAEEVERLQAKIEEMEWQKPAGFVDGDGRAVLQRELHPWADLYALPVVAPSLGEIKITLQRAIELGQRETWTGARKHPSREDQREEQQCWNKVWSLLGAQGEEK